MYRARQPLERELKRGGYSSGRGCTWRESIEGGGRERERARERENVERG